MKHVMIVGGGNMGKALINGIAPVESIRLSLYDADPAKLKEADLAQSNLSICKNFPTETNNIDAIIVCVKPHDLGSVGAMLNSSDIKKSTTLVSILAGVTLEDLSNSFLQEHPIVRAMPNIAAMVGEAATVLSHNSFCNEEQKQLVEKVFQSVGTCYWAEEQQLDAVTGLSGSGPAYLYMVIEALTDGGVKMGLPRELSTLLATQTVLGAAKLVKESGKHPAVLRDHVTTPGGTTIHAVHELEAHGLRSMLISAVVTATKKSEELRKKIK